MMNSNLQKLNLKFKILSKSRKKCVRWSRDEGNRSSMAVLLLIIYSNYLPLILELGVDRIDHYSKWVGRDAYAIARNPYGALFTSCW